VRISESDMAEDRVVRKLAAIFYADVVGYSRLTGMDEEGTHRLVSSYLDEITRLIEGHGGRVLHYAGDAVLAEFASIVVAVTCAVEIQKDLGSRNKDLPEERKVQFRIGVNLGDVIVDEGEIYGDGVNIAARLESLAEPGGICVSRTVYNHIKGKVDLAFEDHGPQTMKNIAEPVHVYRIQSQKEKSVATPISSEFALSLPDKPSIAVLPFENMSGDPEQDYFADGITEDLITALSHIRWLFVIARNSSFVYRGRAVDVKEISRSLGVRYVLEGSVRKSGKRIRVTAQLVDALSGMHHWAERYDRELVDIFDLQDEIVQNVVGAIEPHLFAAEGLRSQTRAPADLDAWDMVARAMSHFWYLTATEIETAVDMLKDTVKRHPDYGPAHSMLAFALVLAVHLWRTEFTVPKIAVESAQRAAQLDDRDPWAHLALGYVAFVNRQTEESIAQFRRALELNPNFAAAHGYLGYPLAFDGRSEEAIASLSFAIRLSPHDRQNPIFMAGMAIAHYLARRYEEAVKWGRKAIQYGPTIAGIYRILIASLAQSGRTDEAEAVLVHLRQMQPEVSLAWAERMVPYTAAQMPHFLEGLKKAGLT